ncbi:MAG: hypothetical protein H0T89_00335 [Deltaproteobacteria bacterium]|nr:hypothetical protein [Deltaproteobacteria bacterium]MDQ3295235.1 phage tail tip lysozyme [Myxococcota bacterium]
MKLIVGFALAVAVATSGCVVGDESLPTEDDLPPAGAEAALSNNARTAFNFFVSKGFTPIQSAGIVGNLMQESGVLPTAVEYGGGPGRGIAQWSVGGRWNKDPINLVAFANARGMDRWGLRTQLEFISHELTTVSSFGLSELRATTTISQAVTVFQNRYERCGTCAQGNRVTYANQVLADYGGGSGGGTAPTGVTCYSQTLARAMPENACVQSKYDGEWYQCASGQWVDRFSNPNPCNGEHPL